MNAPPLQTLPPWLQQQAPSPAQGMSDPRQIAAQPRMMPSPPQPAPPPASMMQRAPMPPPPPWAAQGGPPQVPPFDPRALDRDQAMRKPANPNLPGQGPPPPQMPGPAGGAGFQRPMAQPQPPSPYIQQVAQLARAGGNPQPLPAATAIERPRPPGAY